MTQPKEKTKLLLKGCSCSNCGISPRAGATTICVRGEKDVCNKWIPNPASTIAEGLVSVQPMAKPSGQIFYLKPVISDGNRSSHSRYIHRA